MTKPTQGTSATSTSKNFETGHAVPSLIEAEAHARWRRSFCGRSCTCPECLYKRGVAHATKEPSLLDIDVTEPAFVAAYQQALDLVDHVEAMRKRRIACAIARELTEGRPT
jgi:hypothetical protein